MGKFFGVQKEKLHVTKKEYVALQQLCWLSKNMFNVGLYQVQQHFFNTKKYLCYEENYKTAKSNENYRNNFIRDYLNKATRYIIDYCLKQNIGKIIVLCFANGHPVERQKLGHLRLQDNEPYDEDIDEDIGEDGSEYGSEDGMMGIRIPYGFRSKDMAYALFHNGKAYMLSYLNSYFSPALFRIFVNFGISHHNYILCFHCCPRLRYLPIADRTLASSFGENGKVTFKKTE